MCVDFHLLMDGFRVVIMKRMKMSYRFTAVGVVLVIVSFFYAVAGIADKNIVLTLSALALAFAVAVPIAYFVLRRMK